MLTTKKQLLSLLAAGSLAALVSCDAAAPDPATAGLDANDCPIGTFRPVGLADCVFPAIDVFGQPIGVSDNRCVSGQPAVPPQCTADNGDRPYLAAASTHCAPGYRFLPGSCNRNTGAGGFTFGSGGAGATGSAGATFFPGDVGTAGSTGTGSGTGAAGDGVAGDGVAGTGGAGGGGA